MEQLLFNLGGLETIGRVLDSFYARPAVRVTMSDHVKSRTSSEDQSTTDGIIVTAAPAQVPPALIEQLAPGGRLVIPVGGWRQELRVRERGPSGIRETSLFPVRFVPMIGEAQQRPRSP